MSLKVKSGYISVICSHEKNNADGSTSFFGLHTFRTNHVIRIRGEFACFAKLKFRKSSQIMRRSHNTNSNELNAGVIGNPENTLPYPKSVIREAILASNEQVQN